MLAEIVLPVVLVGLLACCALIVPGGFNGDGRMELYGKGNFKLIVLSNFYLKGGKHALSRAYFCRYACAGLYAQLGSHRFGARP